MYKSRDPNAIQHTIQIPKISDPELAAIQLKKDAAIERKLAESVAKFNKVKQVDRLNAAILATQAKYPEKTMSLSSYQSQQAELKRASTDQGATDQRDELIKLGHHQLQQIESDAMQRLVNPISEQPSTAPSKPRGRPRKIPSPTIDVEWEAPSRWGYPSTFTDQLQQIEAKSPSITSRWDPDTFTTEETNNAKQDYYNHFFQYEDLPRMLRFTYPDIPQGTINMQDGKGIILMNNPVDAATEIAKIIGHLKSLGRNVKCSPEITIKLANLLDYVVANNIIESSTATEITKQFAKKLGV